MLLVVLDYPPLLARCPLSRTTPALSALILHRCVACRLNADFRLNANFRLHSCVDFYLNCVDLHPTTSAYFLACFVVLLGVELLARDYQLLDSPCPAFGVDCFVLALVEVLLVVLLPASLIGCAVCVVF